MNCSSPFSVISSFCDYLFHYDSSNRAKTVSTNRNGTMERQQDKPIGTFCTRCFIALSYTCQSSKVAYLPGPRT